MESSTSDTPSGCSMDVLTDDSFIIIFSFLSLYERITLMRVSKKWKRLLSNPQTWTHLDFWEEQKTNKYWENEENVRRRKHVLKLDTKTWLFPVDDKAVLDFLQKYTCASLKSLYLHTITGEIMAHVKDGYRNLKTISFQSAHRPPYSAFALDTSLLPPMPWHNRCTHTLEYVVQRPAYIKVCEFPLDAISCHTCIEKQQSKLLTGLRDCGNLRRLTITGLQPSYLKHDSLDGLPQELVKINIIIPPRPRRRGRVHHFDYSDQLCTSLQALEKLANMTKFMLSTIVSYYTADEYNIDEFLCSIADKWHELKCLSLSGIKAPSSEMFSSILARLAQLEQLELNGSLATDESIALINKHLKKLTSVNITNGTYTPSGIKSLCGHPSIEKLCLLQKTQPNPKSEWLLAVYDVIRSLPRITFARLMGYRLIALHAHENIPSISPDIQIVVENTAEARIRPD